MLFAVVLLSWSIAPAADREGLLTVVSPGAQVVVEPGAQQARIVLEVRFGSTSDGIPADRSTFLAKMTGFPA